MAIRARMVPRYKSKDDEGGDDDEDSAAVVAAELVSPSLWMVFKLPDKDECIDEEYMALKKASRSRDQPPPHSSLF
jgi:hypothetical protein